MTDSASTPDVPQGPGSVTGAPGLPPGFTGTFTSRFLDAGGVMLHAVVGGRGPALLMVHGWPQTWYQWRLLMPALAEDFTVVAVDQRGIGLSDKPETGYDSRSLAQDLAAVMDALGHRQFAVVGSDTGLLIGYALAADHPDRVSRLVVGEAPLPGVSPALPLILPDAVKDRLWHIPFNQLDSINEKLVAGREAVFIGAEYDASAGAKKLPPEVVSYYVDRVSDPQSLHGSFQLYRQFGATTKQNQERMATKLTMPVLAIGGAQSSGTMVEETMRLVADDVQGLVIPDCGHWLAEQAPEAMLAAITEFLAPYRDAARVIDMAAAEPITAAQS